MLAQLVCYLASQEIEPFVIRKLQYDLSSSAKKSLVIFVFISFRSQPHVGGEREPRRSDQHPAERGPRGHPHRQALPLGRALPPQEL